MLLVTRFVLFILPKARIMKEGPFKGRGLVRNIDLAELKDVTFSCLGSDCPSILFVFLVAQVTGVSILRAGETMEPALRAVCKDVRIGKILIQTNQDTGEPEVSFQLLPSNIRK